MHTGIFLIEVSQDSWVQAIVVREQSAPNLLDLHWEHQEELVGAGIIPKVELKATSGELGQTK